MFKNDPIYGKQIYISEIKILIGVYGLYFCCKIVDDGSHYLQDRTK